MSEVSSVYVIMQYEWTYNDEHNYTTDHNAGHPAGIGYLDQRKAEEACRDMNLREIRRERLGEYGYEFPEYATNDLDGLNSLLESLGLKNDYDLWNTPIDEWQIDEQDKLRVANFFGDMFYTVECVNIDMGPPPGRKLTEAVDIEEERFKNLDI